MSSVVIAGNTSGSITISAPDVSGSNTLTLPVATDTLVGKATTDTLTNKTLVNPTITGLQTLNTPNTFGFKNRIINGGMVIDQRNAGASVSGANSTYAVDRFQGNVNVASKFTMQQNAGSVTPPVGFTKYLGLTSSSAYSIGATEYCGVIQGIEGFNIADLGWGTANAKTVTLSFQVYSSLTGTFGGSVFNGGANRSYPFSYSIPVANTWTTISTTIAGDTTGTWATDNSAGMYINWSVGAGSTASGTAGAWAGTFYRSATGATSVVGTSGATFYITGVQLEKGSTSTSFDFRDYSTELAMCQRYYFERTLSAVGFFASGSGQTLYQSISSPVTMRAAPTSYPISGASNTNCTITTSASSTTDIRVDISSVTANAQNYSLGGVIKASAEL